MRESARALMRIKAAVCLSFAMLVCILSACGGEGVFGGDNTIINQVTRQPGQDAASAPSLLLPHIIARTRLPDGPELAVSLKMTRGQLMTKDNSDYIPTGYMDNIAFEKNYIGEYELVCERAGKPVMSLPVSFSGQIIQNYTDDERFELQFADYSRNGSAQFVLGCGGNAAENRIYNLYAVDSQGDISLSLEGFEHASKSFSPLLELSETGFYTEVFNHANGRYEQVEYVFDGTGFQPAG